MFEGVNEFVPRQVKCGWRGPNIETKTPPVTVTRQFLPAADVQTDRMCRWRTWARAVHRRLVVCGAADVAERCCQKKKREYMVTCYGSDQLNRGKPDNIRKKKQDKAPHQREQTQRSPTAAVPQRSEPWEPVQMWAAGQTGGNSRWNWIQLKLLSVNLVVKAGVGEFKRFPAVGGTAGAKVS